MKDRDLKQYFREQVRTILERSASESDSFRDYFAVREPTDDEILGLLAVSTVSDQPEASTSRFPTAAEALAALSKPSREALCREFRRLLKTGYH